MTAVSFVQSAIYKIYSVIISIKDLFVKLRNVYVIKKRSKT